MRKQTTWVKRRGWYEADTPILTPLKAKEGKSCYKENLKNPNGAIEKKGEIL